MASLSSRLTLLSDAILPRKGPVTRAMSKRLKEDWARAAEEGSRVLMNLWEFKTFFLLKSWEQSEPLSWRTDLVGLISGWKVIQL